MGYKDTDYLHISARIKALEARLLGRDFFDKIIEARSYEDAVKALIEAGYKPADDYNEDIMNFETILDKEKSYVYSFISEHVKNPVLTDIFRIPYDFMNIKAVLKAEFMNINPDSMLFGGGTISCNDIKVYVRERNERKLSSFMAEAVYQSLDSMSKYPDPQQIDLICDRLCYEQLLNMAEASGLNFIYEYIVTKIDLLNISSFLRLRNIGKKLMFFIKTYIPSKSGLDIGFFTSLYDATSAQFIEALMKTKYRELAERLGMSETVSVAEAEAAIDAYTGLLIRKFRYVPFGPQIPLAYLLSKDAEINNVRIALAGKLSGLSGERIRERLRLDYV